MDEQAAILWFGEITRSKLPMVGGKGASLGEMRRAGFPVPPGFCITTAAYRCFVRENRLEEAIEGLISLAERKESDREELEREAATLRERFAAGRFPSAMAHKVVVAYRELGGKAVAVRSSATTEDLPHASFAGQGQTCLGVEGEAELLDRVKVCWASLWTPRAILYRYRHRAEMAVVVQVMILTDVAGVAFSVDPLTGEEVVVIEAVPGLGETLRTGEAEAACCKVERKTLEVLGSAQGVLTLEQVQRLAGTVLALERHFGREVDVEWGFRGGVLYLFQTRPITVRATGYFTTVIPNDHYLWTGGFFSERFPQPVSPLGWSVVGKCTEELGLADPLRFMGTPDLDSWPLTKLYRGHPFVNVTAFQAIYKLFPDFLLPDDTFRYFPGDDTSYRKRVRYPRSLLDPRLVFSMFRSFVRDPGNWSVWHNHRLWSRFLSRYEEEVEDIRRRPPRLGQGNGKARLEDMWQVFEEAQRLSRALLAIHRWSLTHADLTYTLLRKLAAAWMGGEDGICARLVTGLPSKSVELDRELQRLAALAGMEQAFTTAFKVFLSKYGHRSFNLDIYHPPFADDPSQVLELLREGAGEAHFERRIEEREEAYHLVRVAVSRGLFGWLKRLVFDHVLSLARRYMLLREDQRFHWQRVLAAIRRVFILMGEQLVAEGILDDSLDIFFATKDELEAYVRNRAGFPVRLVLARKAEYRRLQSEHELAPQWSYPSFLEGNRPLDFSAAEVQDGGKRCFRGRPLSPGLAKGRVRVVISPGQFAKIEKGDILVTRGADPGWTPLFGHLGGLVMERGGQLSHGAVVAREYGLPAVGGVPDITRLLRDGEMVLVDGLAGTVAVLEKN